MDKLPDEIIRNIYKFINPVFEYINYIELLKDNSNEKIELCNIMEVLKNSVCDGHISEQMDSISIAASYTGLMAVTLSKIDRFLKKNPKFSRPVKGDDLNEYQHKTQDSIGYCTKQIERMERNISIRRGKWRNPDTNNEVIEIHDIVYILQKGSLESIQYSCLINNIQHDHQEYWDVIKNTSAQLKDGRIKRYLIQKLMKI
jgi:hypothetical protein